MFNTLRQFFQHRMQAWVLRRQGHDSAQVLLTRRRIYILPTRLGLLFGAVLFGMLLAAMNYSNSMAFALTFLLAALGLLAMHRCHATLEGLTVRAGRAEPVFAGQTAHFAVVLDNATALPRYALRLADAPLTADTAPQTQAVLHLPRTAPRRGALRAGRVSLSTTWPFGLFRAWTWLHMDLVCIVYPAPAPVGAPPPASRDQGSTRADQRGMEDFAGLRAYQRGDSPRHIAWRASAREQGLLVKQFSGVRGASAWLEWEALPPELDTEARLALLCRWILDLHARGDSYGLRLPGTVIPLAQGEHHRHRCLEALALFAPEAA